MRPRKIVPLAVGAAVCILTACGSGNMLFPDGTYLPEKSDSAPGKNSSLSRVEPIPYETPSEEQEMPFPESTPTLEPTPTPGPEELTITISAAGDVTMGSYFDQGYYGTFDETYDKEQNPAYFFENVYDIFSADDMTIVNLEGPLTLAQERREEQTYCIRGDPEYVKVLTAGSVEAVSMGNNHRLDYFEQGTADTVEALNGVGIPYAYDRYYGVYVTAAGITVGFVSVNEVGQGAGVEKYIKEGIETLREQECGLILVCCHWGTEREYYPEEYQKTLGRKCIDWGADMVIGHHPHVIQGIEAYQGKYIIYSLGNFCFGANRNPSDKDCLIVQQTFTFIDGVKQDETQLKVIPCSVSSVANRNDYRPTPAEGEEAARILEKLNECSRDLGLVFDGDGNPAPAGTGNE